MQFKTVITNLTPDKAFRTEFLKLLSIDAVEEVIAIHRMSGHTFFSIARAGALLNDRASAIS